MRKSFLWLSACIAGLILAIVLSYKASTIKIVPEVSAQVETSEANNLPPPQAAAKTDGYQLIVGANPRLNKQQVFLPPTNSVAITNGEEQLNLLIEQEKKARQQQQQTVQQ